MPDDRWLISELAEEERKSAEEQIKMLLFMMSHGCEGYLRMYVAGKQNVIKTLWEMKHTHKMLGEVIGYLIDKHRVTGYPMD
jgi:hypothetical protein